MKGRQEPWTLERIADMCEIVTESGCWIWMGTSHAQGYGVIVINQRLNGAHRISYAVAHGGIPNGLHVLHRCDVTSCVNPAHLFVGTHQDNMADMTRKGRRDGSSCGTARWNAKLDDQKVKFIRDNYRKQSREFGTVALSRLFGVGPDVIWDVVRGNQWKHVK